MTIKRTLLALTRLALLVSAFFWSNFNVNAASLYGKVEQVDEGDVITVNNLNRPIKIRLIGIDAPEKDQPHAETARQHLAHLVLNKFVVVHYAGLGGNNYIIGRVVADDLDICAQMLRDGVAWFDASSRLSEVERETYSLSEQAARTEKRGLWEDAAPVAPWEFRRALAERPSLRLTPTPKQAPASDGLYSNDLFSAVGGRLGRPTARDDIPGWRTLSPSDYNFSVRVPGNAVENGVTIPTPVGGAADLNISVGSDGVTLYLVMWSKGPHDGTPDSVVIESAAKGFITMFKRTLEQQGKGGDARIERQRSVKNGNFSGTQYKLSATGVVGLVRIYTRHSAKERQLYLQVVANGEENDPQVTEFLNSLKLGQK